MTLTELAVCEGSDEEDQQTIFMAHLPFEHFSRDLFIIKLVEDSYCVLSLSAICISNLNSSLELQRTLRACNC